MRRGPDSPVDLPDWQPAHEKQPSVRERVRNTIGVTAAAVAAAVGIGVGINHNTEAVNYDHQGSQPTATAPANPGESRTAERGSDISSDETEFTHVNPDGTKETFIGTDALEDRLELRYDKTSKATSEDAEVAAITAVENLDLLANLRGQTTDPAVIAAIDKIGAGTMLGQDQRKMELSNTELPKTAYTRLAVIAGDAVREGSTDTERFILKREPDTSLAPQKAKENGIMVPYENSKTDTYTVSLWLKDTNVNTGKVYGKPYILTMMLQLQTEKDDGGTEHDVWKIIRMSEKPA